MQKIFNKEYLRNYKPKPKPKKQNIKELLWSLYQAYYKALLKQMEDQGFNKVEIYKQKVMYEQRQDLFATFIETYHGDECEIII